MPVRGDAGEIRVAPGPDGGLYVSIADDRTHVLALLGSDGAVRPGWPIRVPASWCIDLLGAKDGSVILACDGSDPGLEGLEEPKVRVFRFDDRGRQARGWPVEFAGEVWRLEPRIVGEELAVLIHPYMGDAPPEVPRQVFLGLIDLGGTLRTGSPADYMCCDFTYAIGPDGTGYVVERTWNGDGVTSVVSAFHLDGLTPPWPNTIDFNASRPAFDAEGRIYFAFGELGASPARLLVLDKAGRPLPLSTEELPIALTNPWSGAGEEFPSAPIVGPGGTTYIVAEQDGTRVIAVSNGTMLPGSPFQSSAGIEDAGRCGNEDTGCGVFQVEPVVDGSGVLYISQTATSSSAGGRIIAVTNRGRIVDGWPVTLTRPGAYFTALVPAPGGGIWALALEPEGNGSSGTILAIAPDSTVRWTTTVADP